MKPSEMSIREIAETRVSGEDFLTFPLVYEDTGHYIRDTQHHSVLRIFGGERFGWYAISEKPMDELQDGFGRWVVRTLNEAWMKENQGGR